MLRLICERLYVYFTIKIWVHIYSIAIYIYIIYTRTYMYTMYVAEVKAIQLIAASVTCIQKHVHSR